jgi:hypothetical protein
MSDAVQALLRQAVEEASREAVAEAERRGFAAGLREGMTRATREMRVRLNQLLVDAASGLVLGDDLVLGNATGPGSVAGVDASMQAAGPILAEPEAAPTAGVSPPAGSVPVDAGAVSPRAAPASNSAMTRRAERAAWRTPRAEAIVAEMWPTFTHKADIEARIAEANGVAFPAGVDLSVYAAQVGLKRPEGFMAWRLQAPPKAGAVSAAAPLRDPGYVRLVDRHKWRTDERKAVLLARYPGGALMEDIRAEMAALPGEAMPEGTRPVWNWVSALELRRDRLQQAVGEAAPVDEAEGDDADIPPPPPVEIVPRNCLNCRGAFQANGRFERLCVRCRKRSEVEAA